jgi:hypothetical protein
LLTDFVAGYGGPPGIEYRGGNVRVIAAIVYRDGVLIEWLTGPVPDLSWMPDIGEQSSSFFPQFQDQPEMLERMRRFKRLTSFFEGATLTDNVATEYRYGWGDAGTVEGIGYKGHEAFSPAPPAEARELTVHIHELAIAIALKRDATNR